MLAAAAGEQEKLQLKLVLKFFGIVQIKLGSCSVASLLMKPLLVLLTQSVARSLLALYSK